MHRDRKQWNMLFEEEMNMKMANFSLSDEFTSNKLSTFCGSPRTLPDAKTMTVSKQMCGGWE